ncbi:ABC transporter substrate-binding protein [Nocardia stercoris]|uniref:Putative aliphatic sulfonates-binding protein n=1 Tax=Nocardia stercoris TaxID=2483361 RepID=A0A3M2LB61_9NOCA|nr:ABC transporter substrate-binding protein [Nocardia stercoris]RMI34296.1 ABC transporter substrate-binding protein [Nocardia stercoris]
MKRRLLAALLLTAAVTTAACGTSSNSDKSVQADGSVDLSQVTLNVGDQKGSGLQALLDAAGELKTVPYKISWAQFTSGPPMLEGINSGAVDLGQVGNAPPVFAAAAKSQIKIVESSAAKLEGIAILVPPDSPIKAPADLRGKKIAVAKGSSSNYHLLNVLQHNGLSFNDIQAQYLQPADALAAFSGGKVDAWAVWDPYVAQAQLQLNARVVADGNGYGPNDGFFVAGSKSLQNKGKTAAIRDLLQRVLRAHTWANAHPDDWGKVINQLTGLPLDVAQKMSNRQNTTDHPLDAATIAGEQNVADAFAGANLIPGKVTMTDFIDTRFNDLFPAS